MTPQTNATEVIEQPETNQSEQDGRSFANNEHFVDVAEPETEDSSIPEPESVETAEEAVEATPESETEESAEAVEEATEAEAETGNDWLPAEQEKQFPLETLIEFNNRRKQGWTEEEIRDNPKVQRTLRDLLNTTISFEQQRRERETEEPETNPFEEVATEEAAPATTTATEPLAEHYKQVESIVSALDPKQIEKFGLEVLSAYGVNTDIPNLQKQLADPKLTPAQRAEVTGALQLAQGASKLGQVQAKGAVDIVMSVLPRILPQLLEALYPGTAGRAREMQERQESATAWTQTVAAMKADGKVPAYGTPELQPLILGIEKEMGLPEGGLGALRFNGTNGKPLSYQENAKFVYRMVINHALGRKPTISPQVIAQATETGKAQARQADQKRAQGRAMGAGTASRAFESKPTGDPMRDALRAEIAEDGPTSAPFSDKRWTSVE